MAPVSVHQAVHGYRDGHRLLSNSMPLSADAARSMLVLSDMSGPSMQPGFDEYLTGYPLTGSDFFVLAKTWYAPEMQRPGCVWTHSLLIPRGQVSRIAAKCLLERFWRPQLEGVEKAAAMPIVLDHRHSIESDGAGFNDRAVMATLVEAILGQPRSVIVFVDTATQLEASILRLWETLWPAERARFSFCTGALLPRSNSGALLDLQAVPRTTPPSQFRKSAGAALILDLRSPNEPAPWVELVLKGATPSDSAFGTWLESAAGADAGRSVVPSLVPIFSEWHGPNSSPRSALASVLNARELDPIVRKRLIEMALDRTDRASARRELLQDLCEHQDSDLSTVASMLEDETSSLFEEARAEGCALVLALLGSELTKVGENVLRTAMRLLVPNDLDAFGHAQASFLPTIVGANPSLSSSPSLWRQVGSRSTEVLSQLGSADLDDEERGTIIDAILTSGVDVSVEALVRFGGRAAVFRGLDALTAEEIQLSWPWRSTLSSQPDTVLEWLESLSRPSSRHLDLGSRFVRPTATQSRLAVVWKKGIDRDSLLRPRVAAFGLALALWEGSARSPLLAACFQPTYDAAGHSHLEYDEWDWLREVAPPVSWWRDWDKCERLAAALARLLEKQDASLETVFEIVRGRQAIRKIVAIFEDDREMRPYLRQLRKAAEAPTRIGSRDQRDALLGGW